MVLLIPVLEAAQDRNRILHRGLADEDRLEAPRQRGVLLDVLLVLVERGRADGAIVAAATLSHRYITDRFLPDKAIDLMDEAASRIHMELESKPEEIENLDRRIIQLKIEREALKKEKDAASKERLATLEAELANLEQQSAELTQRWQAEKDKIEADSKIKEQIDKARLELEQAQRAGDLARAGEISYGVIPTLEKQLAEAQATSSVPLLHEEVTAEDIAAVVSRWTGIPIDKMLEGEREKLLHMEEQIGKRVIGQADAVQAVSRAIRRARAGLQDPNRPMGSFLFLGPTGVGKTELTRALADFLFDDPHALVRIDMSEFMEKHSVARLIGAPPGYIGYEEGGQLTEAVRRRPYSVILLDEIEKAHAEVFDVLLQLLDDGRLTDGHGRTVDFRNTVVIMTSNIRSAEDMADRFRPEFLNRIDEIVVFEALTREQLGEIVGMQLTRLNERLAERGLALELTDGARELIAEAGWDPAYGARPLKRAIQRLLENPLALRLLEGEFGEGDVIRAYAELGEIRFTREETLEPTVEEAVGAGR